MRENLKAGMAKRLSQDSLVVGICSLAVLFTGLSGKMEAGKAGDIIFSHRSHAERGIECASCHPAAETSENGSDNLLPGKNDCGPCHDLNKKETCKVCHGETGDPQALGKVSEYSPKFNHTAHLKIKPGCETCHEGITSSDSSFAVHLPQMKTCLTCHDGLVAKKDCIICHEKPEGKYPENHRPKEWIIDHVFEYSVDKGNSCKMCHTNEQCQRCHLDEVLLAP